MLPVTNSSCYLNIYDRDYERDRTILTVDAQKYESFWGVLNRRSQEILFKRISYFSTSIHDSLYNKYEAKICIAVSGVASSISEGDISIYSCSAQLSSFEIKSISKELNCPEHKYMNMSPSLIELATPLIAVLISCEGLAVNRTRINIIFYLIKVQGVIPVRGHL